MKIGIDIRLIGKKRTGDEAVFFNLVKNLAKLDAENEYVLFTDIVNQKILTQIFQKLEIEGKKNFKIVSLENASNKFVWNFLALPQYLRKNPVDIYHTQYITPWFVPKKIKITTIVHDISFNFFPQLIRPLDLLFLKMLIPLSIRRADKIIGVSQFTCDEIEKYYKIRKDKLAYVSNAVGDDFLKQEMDEQKLAEIREKYALPEEFLLYVGTLQPRKNIPMLLEGFYGVKDRLPNLKVVIAGSKNAHNFDVGIDDVIRKHSLEKDVLFPGFVDEEDKKALYALAKVFVFPSFYEGFGIPILEAFAAGAPVLASDIPSLKEVSGEGALLFDGRELDDFKKKLYTICVDGPTQKKLTEAGFERVGLFSWEKSAKEMLAVWQETLHNER